MLKASKNDVRMKKADVTKAYGSSHANSDSFLYCLTFAMNNPVIYGYHELGKPRNCSSFQARQMYQSYTLLFQIVVGGQGQSLPIHTHHPECFWASHILKSESSKNPNMFRIYPICSGRLQIEQYR